MILLAISFIAGILSVLAPCVLPLLPVIVGGSITGERSLKKAAVICVSLGTSVLLFTLLLKASTVFINVPPATWQWISGIIIILFGLVTLFPSLWDRLGVVNVVNRQSNRALAVGYQRNSFWGDVLMGAALGPVFASCSPTYFIILATVLPVSFAMGVVDLFAYVIGLSGFLFLIAYAGQRLVDKLGITVSPTGWFRRTIAIIFIVLGILIITGVEKKIEVWLSYRGLDATKLEQKLLGGDEVAMPVPTGDMQFLSPEVKALSYKRAPELVSPAAYLNTGGKPVTLAEYRGDKVVLIDIWTYSCINCQRTLPYITKWHETYKDMGLEVIGVHTPEFAFEKVPANVEKAIAQWGIKYPVILDNDFKTWSAFGNQYWPRKYLIDIDGYIVYDHIGEGGYEETEAAIQRALAERAVRLGLTPEAREIVADEVVTDTQDGRVASPEIYFGAWRNEYLGNGEKFVQGIRNFPLPKPMPLRKNTLYLYGEWDIQYEYAKNTKASSEITFKYDAKNVYMVARADKPVRMQVYVNAKLISEFIVQEDRLYDIVKGDDYRENVLDIKILDPGLEAYTFTFG